MRNHTPQSGAAMLIFIIFFVFASSALAFALSRSIYSDAAAFNSLVRSTQSFLAAESLADDIVYRYAFDTYDVDTNETLTVADAEAMATTSFDFTTDEYQIDVAGDQAGTVRKTQVILTVGSGSAFNYGLQAGTGGITMANSASVIGNVYSNGALVGQGSAAITGDAVSAGPTGLIDDVNVSGSAFANTIRNSDIGGDAHYNFGSGNNVSGTTHSPHPNQATATMPISDELVEEWKDAIENHGTVIAATDPECSSGTYTISSDMTLGYVKVECDLNIRKSGPSTTVTLDGPIWVTGDIAFTQGPVIRVDPALGRRSVQMIADNESDRLTSSQIEIRNATEFFGSGDDSSYVMLLSMNESAELGGGETAISMSQSAQGDVLVYAEHGLVDIGNGIELREVTAYQIDIAQNSDVIYEDGLANLLFTSGPGGVYVIHDWQEVY